LQGGEKNLMDNKQRIDLCIHVVNELRRMRGLAYAVCRQMKSALDAMSFYQLNANKIKLEESVFCSVGGYISPNQIKNTLSRYPQAKVHTCFDNDLNGNLYDIKVHGIISNSEIAIKENKDDVLFKTKGREFSINKNDISLESFREKSKIVAPMISHKAEKAKDFNEILMKQHEQKKSIKL
jgi:hypothetical protein